MKEGYNIMPSYRPRITVYTDAITNEKLAYLANMENRSSSNYTENLIKKAIKEYEKEHGEIVVSDEAKESPFKKQFKKEMEIVKAIQDGEMGKIEGLKQSYKTGRNI